MMRWVLGILNREGRKITRNDMELFLTKTGTDMGNIEREVEKLICYTMGREVITREDIEAVCTTQISNHIFDMIRAVTRKKSEKGSGALLRFVISKRTTYADLVSSCTAV